MPDREKIDSPQVPEDRDRQRTNMVRLVAVVGLPLLSVLLRLPIWFTLLLMLGLAVALFIAPYLSAHKEQPDAKKAWTLLMANYVKLQSACDALRQSPDDPEARRRYATYGQRCMSLLASRPDTDWGSDTGYAARIKDEITAMSASFGAKSEKTAPAPGREAHAPAPAPKPAEARQREITSPATDTAVAPKAEPEIEPRALAQPPTPVTEATIARPESSVTTVEPAALTPAEVQTLAAPGEIAVAQREASAKPSPEAEVPALTVEPSPEPPVEAVTAQLIKPEAPTLVEEHQIAPTVEVAVVQLVASSTPSPAAEVPPLPEKQSPRPPVEPVTTQPVKSDAPTLDEAHEIAPVSEAAGVRLVANSDPSRAVEVPPPTKEQNPEPLIDDVTAQSAKSEVPAPVETREIAPARVVAATQTVSPAPAESPSAAAPAEKPVSSAETEVLVAQTESPALPATPEVRTEAETEVHASAPTEGAPAMLVESDAAAAPASVNPAEEQPLTSATGVSEPAPDGAAPTAEPVVPAPTVEQATVSGNENEDLLTDAGSSPTALTVVPAPSLEQDVADVVGDATIQAANPASAAGLSAAGNNGRRLIPYVWLPGGVEEAAAFYSSVFKHSRVTGIRRYPEGAYAPGNAMSAAVNLDGQELILLNGGPAYGQPEAFSLLVRCADQAEIDYYWERLPAGGGEVYMCGWLKDRFGVSWQVIPDALLELLNDPDPQRAARANQAMLRMKKIDIAGLREAAEKAAERAALAAS